jgi:hypothetical protein
MPWVWLEPEPLTIDRRTPSVPQGGLQPITAGTVGGSEKRERNLNTKDTKRTKKKAIGS